MWHCTCICSAGIVSMGLHIPTAVSLRRSGCKAANRDSAEAVQDQGDLPLLPSLRLLELVEGCKLAPCLFFQRPSRSKLQSRREIRATKLPATPWEMQQQRKCLTISRRPTPRIAREHILGGLCTLEATEAHVRARDIASKLQQVHVPAQPGQAPC
jgi:hypothetical protein